MGYQKDPGAICQYPNHSLQTIRFVNRNEESIKAFMEEFEIFSD